MTDALGVGQHRDAAPRHGRAPRTPCPRGRPPGPRPSRARAAPRPRTVVQELHGVGRQACRGRARRGPPRPARGSTRQPRGPPLSRTALPGAEGEGGDLDQRIGTRLEDHGEHAQRAALLRQDQPLVELAVGEHRPERVGTRGELTCAVGQRLELRGVQPQPLHQRRGESGRRGEIARVRLEHPGAHLRVDQRRGQRLEGSRCAPRPGARARRPPASTARCTRSADRAHDPSTRLSRVTSAS